MLKPHNTFPLTAEGRSAIRTRLDTLARQHPEWYPWLRLFAAVVRALAEPRWAEVVPRLDSDRPGDAPLLAGAELAIPAGQVQRWIRQLLRSVARGGGSQAASLAAGDLSRLDALALLTAAMVQDEAHLRTLAAAAGVDPQALGALASLAVMPLLQACRAHLERQLPATWSHGYCPLCGAWPAWAELRGLERSRRLRCGRCGGDWPTAWLWCPYCGETDHRNLGFLLPTGSEESRQVATCATCRRYLKSLATLQASPAHAVALEDLASVDLDLVALERGYLRPARPGYAVALRLVEQPGSGRLRALFGRKG